MSGGELGYAESQGNIQIQFIFMTISRPIDGIEFFHVGV